MVARMLLTYACVLFYVPAFPMSMCRLNATLTLEPAFLQRKLELTI